MPNAPVQAAAEGLPKFNRRRALMGITSLAAAGVVATPARAETPVERLERLAEEMSEALVEWTEGQFMAVVYPANHPQFPSHVQFNNCLLDTARARRDYHLAKFKQAAEELDPSIYDWEISIMDRETAHLSLLMAAFRRPSAGRGERK